MSVIWHNGIFKNDEPVLEPSDRLRLGDGVFDTMLAVNGRPVFGPLHFQRLMFHASVLDISYDIVGEVFENAALELLQRNGKMSGSMILRTLLTRGPSEGALRIPANQKPQMLMRISDAAVPLESLNVVIAQNVRRNEGSPLSRIKSVNCGDQILGLQEAAAKNANDAILLNNAGRVTCASAGNIFVVINNRLVTPPLEDGVMAGILRGKIIERYDAAECSLSADDLMNSPGVYITNSVRGAIAIRKLNGKDLPEPVMAIDPEIHLR
ncbi:MAG: aminotransferase class IV [Alphaproteobacteria bacterium]